MKVTAFPVFPTASALSIFYPQDNTQFSIHGNESSTSQLIKVISKDLQKFLKYFNGTVTFTFSFFPFAPSATKVPIRLGLCLNEELLALHPFALVAILSLLNCH